MNQAKQRLSGGCQCGEVRFEAQAESLEAHYCHCRMCQKAVGNIFATFWGVRKADIEWSQEPDQYRSSALAQRGFCRICGTPLSFAYDRSEWMGISVGALDHPEQVHPTEHCGIEARVSTFAWEDSLPKAETQLPGGSPTAY